jgi:hypothetical protein
MQSYSLETISRSFPVTVAEKESSNGILKTHHVADTIFIIKEENTPCNLHFKKGVFS